MIRLIRATATVGSLTLVSRILGFVRDMVIARYFGASAGTDAFFVAFKIPNFFRRLFAEGAFSQAFVPVLTQIQTQEGREAIRPFIAAVAFKLSLIVSGVVIFGMVFSHWLLMLLTPGFADQPEKLFLAGELLSITFPYLLLITWVALSGALLNSQNHFFAPAITPIWLNISLIGAAIFAQDWFTNPIFALAWGVVLAGLLQWLFNLPYLAKYGLLVLPKPLAHQGVKRVEQLMLPALFGVSVAQINLLADTILASFLMTGSISWLYYSDRLMEFPLGIFGVALATVALPTLSKAVAANRLEDAKSTLNLALALIFLLGLPATAGLVVLAGPLLSTLFQYGAFSSSDVDQAQWSLMAYSLGLVGFILVKVLAAAFYARQNTKTPVKIAVIAMVTNLVLSLALIGPLTHGGLALATSIAAWVNGLALAWLLFKDHWIHLQQSWVAILVKSFIASLIMVAFLLYFSPHLQDWHQASALVRGQWLGALLLLALVVYALSLALLGFRIHHLRHGATP